MSIWRDVVDNPNYEVSDTGQIRRKGSDNNKATCISKDGYETIHLYLNGVCQNKRVSRVVAQAFIDNPENKPEVNHKDGNKLNNHASNLEWNTKKENVRHAWDNGLVTPSRGMFGKNNPNAGRKGKSFRIVETGEIFNTLCECEKAINGNNRHISECLNGKQQTHRGYHFEYL